MNAQWKAINGTNQAYNDLLDQRLRGDRLASSRATATKQVDRHLQEPLRRLAGAVQPAVPGVDQQRPEHLQHRLGRQAAAPPARSSSQSIDTTAQTITLERNPKWWGDKAILDRIIYRVIDGTPRSTRWPTARSTSSTSARTSTSCKRAEGIQGVEIRRAGGPNFRHITINGTSPILSGRERPPGDRQGDRPADHRRRHDRPAGWRLARSWTTTSSCGTRRATRTTPVTCPSPTSTARTSSSTRPAGPARATAPGPRTASRSTIRFVIPSGVATSAQESQLVQGMLEKIGVKVDIQTVADRRLLRQVRQHRRLRPHGLLVDRHAVPDQLVAVDLRASPRATEIQQNYARDRLRRDRRALRRRPRRSWTRRRRVDIANKIDALIWDEVHSITLYQRPDIVGGQEDAGQLRCTGLRHGAVPGHRLHQVTPARDPGTSGRPAATPASLCVLSTRRTHRGQRRPLRGAHSSRLRGDPPGLHSA